MNIKEKCDLLKIENYSINEDESIDVEGDVNLSNMELLGIPINFRKIVGKFDCSGNNLHDLENCPIEVIGSFDCSNNYISSLKDGPKAVEGHYFCHDNRIKSLEGLPSILYKNFYGARNKLKNLKGSPIEIKGDFSCALNKLESLEGCSSIIEGDFNIYSNSLKMLDYFPQTIGGKFIYGENPIEEIMKIFVEHLDVVPRMLQDYTPITENRISKYRFDQMMEEILGEVISYEFKEYVMVD